MMAPAAKIGLALAGLALTITGVALVHKSNGGRGGGGGGGGGVKVDKSAAQIADELDSQFPPIHGPGNIHEESGPASGGGSVSSGQSIMQDVNQGFSAG